MTLLRRPFRGILIALWAVQCALFWPDFATIRSDGLLQCLPHPTPPGQT